MISRTALWPVFALTLLMVTALPVPAGAAEDDGDLTTLTCKEVMILSGVDRDNTISFIHGYIVGKQGATDVDLDKLTDSTETFMNTCLDNPTAKAIPTMEAASK